MIARLRPQLLASLVNQVSEMAFSREKGDFSIGDLFQEDFSTLGCQAIARLLASPVNQVSGSLFWEKQDSCLGTPVSGGPLLSRLPVNIEAAPLAVRVFRKPGQSTCCGSAPSCGSRCSLSKGLCSLL